MSLDIPCALVVDDEVSMLTLLRACLQREGFFVDCVSNVNEAVQLMQSKAYDLILVDVLLGDENGVELLRKIRKHDQRAQVVLITGNPDVESAAEALRLGACDYLVKPFPTVQVISVARKAVNTKRLLEENRRKQANQDAIFQSVMDGIILVDRAGCLLQANEAALSFCGYLPEHMNMPIQFIERNCSMKCRDSILNVLNDGMPRRLRRLACDNGSGNRLVISMNVSPVLGSQNNIEGAVAVLRDETELTQLQDQLHKQYSYGGIIGGNGSMRRLYALIDALANVQTTVLVNGESGTGKELVADALHYQGARRDKPLVKLNCAALSDQLLESELFGHVRGAYTGAETARVGRFQQADGGTIFLDEIGDISPAMQMRLLRVLQEQEFEPLGASKPIKVNVRVIAATSQNLAEKVRLGTFRHDLYFRLNVVRLIIPPLRDRLDDMMLLTDYFLKKFNEKFKKSISRVSQEVMELFQRHSWPGNVRELEHVLEHGALLCPSDVIDLEHLPRDMTDIEQAAENGGMPPVQQEPPMTLRKALEKAGGNKAKAARLLGVSRCTVYRWLNSAPE